MLLPDSRMQSPAGMPWAGRSSNHIRLRESPREVYGYLFEDPPQREALLHQQKLSRAVSPGAVALAPQPHQATSRDTTLPRSASSYSSSGLSALFPRGGAVDAPLGRPASEAPRPLHFKAFGDSSAFLALQKAYACRGLEPAASPCTAAPLQLLVPPSAAPSTHVCCASWVVVRCADAARWTRTTPRIGTSSDGAPSSLQPRPGPGLARPRRGSL